MKWWSELYLVCTSCSPDPESESDGNPVTKQDTRELAATEHRKLVTSFPLFLHPSVPARWIRRTFWRANLRRPKSADSRFSIYRECKGRSHRLPRLRWRTELGKRPLREDWWQRPCTIRRRIRWSGEKWCSDGSDRFAGLRLSDPGRTCSGSRCSFQCGLLF